MPWLVIYVKKIKFIFDYGAFALGILEKSMYDDHMGV